MCGTKKRTKEKPTRQIVSRLKSAFPRRAPDSEVAMNSHIRVLKQHDDPAPLSCTRLGYYLNGVKSQNINTVTPAKAGVQKLLKELDSAIHQNGI